MVCTLLKYREYNEALNRVFDISGRRTVKVII
jgi:hypothetical protein